MAKLIKAYKDNFTIVDNDIFKDERLSLKELGLLCQLLSLPDDWNFSVTGLSTLHKDGEDSIKAGIKKLEEYGYLTRRRSRDISGLYTGNDYLIYRNPLDNPDFKATEETAQKGGDYPSGENPLVDNPLEENPLVDKPLTDKPLVENQPQYITKEIKKERINEYVTEGTDPSDMEEEMKSWSEDDFYSHLSSKQYDAFTELLQRSIRGEIRSSKESLFVFFKKMMTGGWKDAKGKPIKNIVSYVTTVFNATSEENKTAEKPQMEDIDPVYDVSKNPPFDEDKFNGIMEELKKEREEKKK